MRDYINNLVKKYTEKIDTQLKKRNEYINSKMFLTNKTKHVSNNRFDTLLESVLNRNKKYDTLSRLFQKNRNYDNREYTLLKHG